MVSHVDPVWAGLAHLLEPGQGHTSAAVEHEVAIGQKHELRPQKTGSGVEGAR